MQYFWKTVTVHEYNKGDIALTVASKMWPSTNHAVIKYHHFQSFVKKGDTEINDFDTKEQITFILWSHWISSFLDIYAASITGGIKTVSLFKREYKITQMEHVS